MQPKTDTTSEETVQTIVHGVNRDRGRETAVGMICERDRFWVESQRVREIYDESGESTEEEDVTSVGANESDIDRMEWGSVTPVRVVIPEKRWGISEETTSYSLRG